MTIFGTAGDDSLNGTAGTDTFDVTQGGIDEIFGLDDNDVVLFGTTFDGNDRIDGGNGIDEVRLTGDYSVVTEFNNNSFVSVERLRLTAGFDYNLILKDDNAATGFVVSASTLGAGDDVTLDATRETDERIAFSLGAGNDTVLGGNAGNGFVPGLGSDTLTGGDGLDNFNFGTGGFEATDSIDGGSGSSDIILLTGDYSAGLLITKSMMKNIEQLQLDGAFAYDIAVDRKTIPNGESLNVVTFSLPAGGSLTFDGSAMRTGSLILHDTVNDDVFIGSRNDDGIVIDVGGNDTVDAGAGDDELIAGAELTRNDAVDGGDDYDTLELNGDYSAGLTLRRHTVENVEELRLDVGHSYSLTTNDKTVKAAQGLLVTATQLGAGDTLIFDAGAETDGIITVLSGDGDDIITGGSLSDGLVGGDGDDRLNGVVGDDFLTGGMGSDRFNGGMGADTYVINSVAESTGAGYDIAITFNANIDVFDLATAVTGIDTAVNAGTLSTATFDANLAAAIGAGQLANDHAVLFTPNAGDLAGDIFLIVESGGAAGYQAGQDFVIKVTNAINLGSLSTTNFE